MKDLHTTKHRTLLREIKESLSQVWQCSPVMPAFWREAESGG
jgi:hypothetical protein